MKRDYLTIGGAYTFAIALSTAISAYYYYLRSPAVVSVRPELATVGCWTAAFSGRFVEWLFYTEPLYGAAMVFAFWTVIVTIALFGVRIA